MQESRLKRWWRDLTSPLQKPASYREPETIPSLPQRLWKALRPVPPDLRRMTPEEIAARRRQQNTMKVGTALVLVSAMVWGAYRWAATAQQRAQAKYEEGMHVMATGDYKTAENVFTSAIDMYPKLAQAYLERGLVRKARGDSEEAFQDFARAIEVDPKLVQAYTEAGLIFRSRGDLKSAVAEFTKAIELGDSTDAYYQRGQLYQALGNMPDALADYNRAIQVDPDAPYMYRARASVRAATGDNDGADEDRRTANRIEGH